MDIENTTDPDAPLLEWHSFKFVSLKSQIRREKRSAYQHKIDSFANDPQFSEIIGLMLKHGNNRFNHAQIETIWTLHRDGVAERKIAHEMGCSKSCIHFLLKRITEWMKLVV